MFYRVKLVVLTTLWITAAGCKDSQKPAWPKTAELAAEEVTGTSLSLSWPAATDNKKVVAYRILGQREASGDTKKDVAGLPKVIGKVGGERRSFSARGLSEAAEYSFRVTAEDRAGNVSPPLKLSAKTKDVTGPGWNGEARLTFTRADSEGKTRLTFAWPAATDNVGVTRFRLKMGKQAAAVKGDARGHTLTTDSPGGMWQLEAGDAAGNWSKHPLQVRVTTDPQLKSPVAGVSDLEARAARRRARLAAAVARMGVLKLLGTMGSGSGGDMIASGNLMRGRLDSAFSGTGGLTVVGRGGGLRGGSGGGAGRVVGIGGLKRRGGGLRGGGGGGASKVVGVGGLARGGGGTRGRGTGGSRLGGRTGSDGVPRVKLGSGPVEVSRYLRRKLSRIKRCYEKALLTNPGLSGDLSVTLAADAAGKVSASAISGIPNAGLVSCVRTAVLGRGDTALSGTVMIKLEPGKSSK